MEVALLYTSTMDGLPSLANWNRSHLACPWGWDLVRSPDYKYRRIFRFARAACLPDPPLEKNSLNRGNDRNCSGGYYSTCVWTTRAGQPSHGDCVY
jgi:hypothetical protein